MGFIYECKNGAAFEIRSESLKFIPTSETDRSAELRYSDVVDMLDGLRERELRRRLPLEVVDALERL